MEIFFWPVINLLVWGFVTLYLQRIALPKAVVFLLGVMILFDVLYRSQQAITLSITEEFWVKNIINIFITPVRMVELLLANCLVGILKSVATTIFLGLLAYALYAFNVMEIGWALLPFFLSLLLFGWAMGMLTMSLILRYGHAAEAFIWGVPFLLQPISAVFYPVDVLPGWLQKVAYALPSTYVFEGMRRVLSTGSADWAGLFFSLALNLVYLAGGSAVLGWMLNNVRRKGYLSRLQME